MNKTIIIAEAGVNHNGDINTAKRLIDVAAKAGVDYVKFQTFKADRLVSPKAKKAKYQIWLNIFSITKVTVRKPYFSIINAHKRGITPWKAIRLEPKSIGQIRTSLNIFLICIYQVFSSYSLLSICFTILFFHSVKSPANICFLASRTNHK